MIDFTDDYFYPNDPQFPDDGEQASLDRIAEAELFDFQLGEPDDCYAAMFATAAQASREVDAGGEIARLLGVAMRRAGL